MSALGEQHNRQCSEYYTQVKERRHIVDVKQVEYDHVVKIDGTASGDLPKAGAAGDNRQAAAVPVLVFF
jgi:hypothetical protein